MTYQHTYGKFNDLELGVDRVPSIVSKTVLL